MGNYFQGTIAKSRSMSSPVVDTYLLMMTHFDIDCYYIGHNSLLQILEPFKTGLCQKKNKELLVAIERAWDQGFLTYDVPFREYDYSLYSKSV